LALLTVPHASHTAARSRRRRPPRRRAESSYHLGWGSGCRSISASEESSCFQAVSNGSLSLLMSRWSLFAVAQDSMYPRLRFAVSTSLITMALQSSDGCSLRTSPTAPTTARTHAFLAVGAAKTGCSETTRKLFPTWVPSAPTARHCVL